MGQVQQVTAIIEPKGMGTLRQSQLPRSLFELP
jgi:hypothetical protein